MGPDGRSRGSVGGGSGGADGRSPPLGRSLIADRLSGSRDPPPGTRTRGARGGGARRWHQQQRRGGG